MSKFRITTAIRSALMANEELQALVGDKIMPIRASKGTDGDFVAYWRDRYTRKRTNMGYYDECEVFLACVSEDHERSQIIAELVDKELEGVHAEFTGALEDSIEDMEDGKYIQLLKFKLE